jgi:ABC-type Zn uptake system ZnuABC Zn-binding protein ZnuA
VRKKILILSVFYLFTLALPFESWASNSGKLKVLTTVSPLTNIAHNIGGSLIELHGLIPEGTDSHTFEPAPSDVRFIAASDLIVLNGLHLEAPTERLVASNKKPRAVVIKLGDQAIREKDWIYDFSFPKERGDPNPHLWLNVAHAMRYAELIRDALMQLDPENKPIYERNAKIYLKRLTQLDGAIKTAMQTIPAKNRKLVTYHDSFAYFCPRYGCTVIAAIQPSDFSEPAPRDIAALIDQLKTEQIPAIFGSEVFPSKVMNQVGKEAGVKFVTTLRDDDLPGPEGSPQHTYIGMIIEDVRTIVRSLGGNDDSLKEIKPEDRTS